MAKTAENEVQRPKIIHRRRILALVLKASRRKFSKLLIVGLCLLALVAATGVVRGNHRVDVKGSIGNKPHTAARAPESETSARLLAELGSELCSIARRLAVNPSKLGLSRGLIPQMR
jgi:hypothetical protein